MRCGPGLAEHWRVSRFPRCQVFEERPAFIRQDDVTRLSRLALPDGYRPNVRVEISDRQAAQLAIASARLQRGLHQRSKLSVACIDEPLCLSDCQIAKARAVNV